MQSRSTPMVEIRWAGRPLRVPAGELLHRSLLAAGLPVESPCGGTGRCGRCRVRFLAGVPAPTAADRRLLGEDDLAGGWRLACQHLPQDGAELEASPTWVAAFTAAPGRSADAHAAKGAIVLPPVPRTAGEEEAGPLLGLCLDLGTTTLAGYLLDLRTGQQLAALARPNPQVALGADVMTRLGHALRPGGREELRRLLLEGVNALIAELCRRAGAEGARVRAAVAVGNTAMHHLFLGLPVESLAVAPYVPASTEPRWEEAARVGLAIDPGGLVYLPPLLGGFAGSDIAAVLLATRLWEAERPVLALDLGTNGEALLGDRAGVLAASAPAGPAFEGAGLSSGQRAGPGAIVAVALAGTGDEVDLTLEVNGGGEPTGLCGSGAVDAVAALLRAGVMDASGRLRLDRLGALPPRLAARIRAEGAGSVILWEGGRGAIALTQADVRQLQLAKAAVRSACDVLLAERGIAPADLEAVLLAGAFGNYVRAESALAIGLLPPVPAERVVPIGNAAAVGGMLCLLSEEARLELEARAPRVRHVPLAARPDFQERFLEATWFPPGPLDRGLAEGGLPPAGGTREAAPAAGSAAGRREGSDLGKGGL